MTGVAMTEPIRRVTQAAEELAKVRERVTDATEALYDAVRAAVAAGERPADVARVAGVSRQRVNQIAPRAETVRTPVHAQKNVESSVCVASADTVPVLPDTLGEWRSGRASTRERQPYGKTTTFREPGSLLEILSGVTGSGRIYLTGRPPFDTSTGATQAEAVRAWALGELPAGWIAGSHYLHEADKPTLRFTGPTGEKVTVMRAASWWGETDASPEVCEAAWRGLGTLLDAVPAFKGAGIADTPATAGRALWARTIPAAGGYDVLSDELRELIAATSGQGRRELRAPARDAVERFTYVDGRFMYAALTWGMPVGEPRRWTGAEVDALDGKTVEKLIRGRGRWRITCKVPDGWAHVGLFMAPEAGGGWCYPDQPGQVLTTWCDGAELWNAMVHGWEPVIHEGITWAEGKPLNVWTDALVDVWRKASVRGETGSEAAALASKAVRSMLLYAVGAFATRAHPTTGTTPADRPEEVPEDVIPSSVRRVGDALVWEKPAKVPEWSASKLHPEWSATIWARARVRLLDGPGKTGALHLPADRIIAMSTDALYLDGAPDWDDDGRPGRFRVKGALDSPVAWPSTYSDLYTLRDRSENDA